MAPPHSLPQRAAPSIVLSIALLFLGASDVLGPAAGIAILEDVQGAEGVIVTKDAMRVQTSQLGRHAVIASDPTGSPDGSRT